MILYNCEGCTGAHANIYKYNGLYVGWDELPYAARSKFGGLDTELNHFHQRQRNKSKALSTPLQQNLDQKRYTKGVKVTSLSMDENEVQVPTEGTESEEVVEEEEVVEPETA